MKFCFVFDGLGCGGIERVGVDYCNALIERGHEVTVVNLSPSLNEFAEKLIDKVDYIAKSFPRSHAPERYSTLISRAAWGRFAYPLAFTACTVALAAKKPFLRRLGVYDVAIAFSGHYNDLTFVAYGCVRAAKKLAWLHGTVNGYALIGEGYMNLYKHFDTLVCLSDEGIEEFRDAKHWLNLPLRKLYNPIESTFANENAVEIKELHERYGDFVLMVARLASPKDPNTLIDAMEILKEKYGIEKNCVIVGDGPDLEKTKSHLGGTAVSNSVHLVGYESNPESYYEACRLFVLSSLNEGLPTVLLEAMVHGKPVVSTNVPGAREILENGKDGLLCGIRDADGMAKQIASLFGDAELYYLYSQRAAERAKDFSTDKAINGLLDIVDATLEQCEKGMDTE